MYQSAAVGRVDAATTRPVFDEHAELAKSIVERRIHSQQIGVAHGKHVADAEVAVKRRRLVKELDD